MVAVTKSITINKPVEKVFSFISDYRNDPIWRNGVLAMRQEPENTTAAGTRTFESIKFMGRKLTVQSKVDKFIPGAYVSFSTISSPIKTSGYRKTDAAGESSTEFTYSLEAELTGIYKLFANSIAKSFSTRVQKDLELLKNILEANP